MSNLDRFRAAQDAPHAGFAAALRELKAGRKTGHWIWYVLPQLVGLGRSSTAVYYGLADAQEAADYLRDPVLGERLIAAAAAVRSRLAAPNVRPMRIAELMGSEIDALKLVSCMTLFRHVASALYAVDPQPQFAAMAEHADAILASAAEQGYSPCAHTEEHLRRPRP
jgi:uncharacterized protein (DUF1810 family)